MDSASEELRGRVRDETKRIQGGDEECEGETEMNSGDKENERDESGREDREEG